jgi:hypothetical protein
MAKFKLPNEITDKIRLQQQSNEMHKRKFSEMGCKICAILWNPYISRICKEIPALIIKKGGIKDANLCLWYSNDEISGSKVSLYRGDGKESNKKVAFRITEDCADILARETLAGYSNITSADELQELVLAAINVCFGREE